VLNTTSSLRRVCLALLTPLLVLAFSACGSDRATPTALAQPTPTVLIASATPDRASTVTADTTPSAQEVQVTLKEWAVEPAVITVSAGKIHFVVTNKGELSHNFTILDGTGALGATRTFAASESPQSFDLDLPPGTYQTLCSVPGHAQHGQKGILVVK
jgi:plastocyanin